MFHIVEHLSTMRFVFLYQRKDSSVKKNNFAGIHLLLSHLRIPATGGRIKKFGSLCYRLKNSFEEFPGDKYWFTRRIHEIWINTRCIWFVYGKTSYPLNINNFLCQGFFSIKSFWLTKVVCNYILLFLRVRSLSSFLIGWLAGWFAVLAIRLFAPCHGQVWWSVQNLCDKYLKNLEGETLRRIKNPFEKEDGCGYIIS